MAVCDESVCLRPNFPPWTSSLEDRRGTWRESSSVCLINEGTLFDLDDAAFQLLEYACTWHTDPITRQIPRLAIVGTLTVWTLAVWASFQIRGS